MIKKITLTENRPLEGTWVEATFEEAMQGKVANHINNYIKDKNVGDIFIGVSSHHRKDGFNYLVGKFSEQGKYILPSGNYLVANEVEDAYQTYLELMKDDHQFLSFFDSSLDNDHIPVKIEKYQVTKDGFKLYEIEVPIR